MSRIDLRQLDDFDPNLITNIKDGESIRWKDQNKQFNRYLPFGAITYSEKEENATTTSSTTFVTHQELVTPVTRAGKYFITWDFIWYTNNVNAFIEVRVQEHNTTLTPVNFIGSTSSELSRLFVTFQYVIEIATPRALTVNLAVRRNSGPNANVVLRMSKIKIFSLPDDV